MMTPLRVLVVDDDPGRRDGMALSLKRAGFLAEQARGGDEALRMARPGAFNVVMTDLRMPGMDGLQLLARLKAVDPTLPVLFITAFSGSEMARETLRLGAFDVLSRPFSTDELTAALQKARNYEGHLKAEEPAEVPVTLTQDPGLGETLTLGRRAADSRATILIQAENGTGRELLARLIHNSSLRRNGPFITINCAAIPENLLESELFGHEKGAFAGATGMKQGCFERATGGTLVLDEVGELPPGLQGQLLRVLQERTVDRLGGAHPIPVDVRLISLTSHDLLAEVKAGRFSEELYYRLNVIPLDLPPLRDRPDDLSLLASYFAERYARENDRAEPELVPSFFAGLARHLWTGNLRELENVIQRCVVLSRSRRLSQHDLHWLLPAEALEGLPGDPPERAVPEPRTPLPTGVAGVVPRRETVPPPTGAVVADPQKPLAGLSLGTPVVLPLGLSLPELERFWLLTTLSALKGNRTHCAEQLDIALRTVRNKINEYKADGFAIPPSMRGRDDE